MKSKKLKVINPVPDITLFAVNMVTRGFQQPKWKKYIGLNFDETVSAYKDNFAEWSVPLRLWRKIGSAFFNKISSNKAFAKLVHEKHLDHGRILYKQCDEIRRKDIRSLTNRQILSAFKRLQRSFGELCFWGVVPPAIDFENNLLTGALEKKLTRAIAQYKIKESLQEAFSILITPKELTYMQKEKDDLLKLAVLRKTTEKDIQKHWYKYCWVDYGYVGPAYTLTSYKRRLLKLRKSVLSPRKRLVKIAQERRELLKRQRTITQALRFDTKTKYLFQIARDFMFLKLYRKEVMFKANYTIDLLFEEIGKRFGYTVRQLHYCLPGEIIKLLKGTKLDKKVISTRVRSYFVHTLIKGKDTFYYGKKAKEYMKFNLFKEKINTKLEQVSGMSAYIGKAIGVVVVVNKASEMKKVKKGDVLVSIATSPAVLPAMKLASAFVTDTGGITCHAAIIAREMKKPCVIGTKIATKVFRDGDRVEVDANKGIVKKIKK